MEIVLSKFLELILKVVFFALMAFCGIKIGIKIKKNKQKKENNN